MSRHTRKLSISQRLAATTDNPWYPHTMRSVYGEMILPKGTILYHSSTTPFRLRSSKPMLFTMFHPSEYAAPDGEYITPVVLQRDISLFFMVSDIINLRPIALLDILINKPGNNIDKKYDYNLACYVRHLKREHFDGWFSTIENREYVEVALINDPTIFTTESSHKLSENVSVYDNLNYRPRKYHSIYPLTTLKNPVTLNINRQFEEAITRYLELSKGVQRFAFQAILSNAQINYHNAPAAYINWSC